MKNKLAISAGSFALALSISPALLADNLASGDELISNGSFENFVVSRDNGSWKLVDFTGWQGNGEAWNGGIGRAATDGTYKIELDVGGELNTLSQSVGTTAGQKYRFSLDAYARRGGTSDFQVLVDGQVIATISPDSNWNRFDAYFTGSGGTQTVSIKELDAQSNGLGTIIDNVSLMASNELLNNGSLEDFTISQNNGRWKLVEFTGWQGSGEVWTNRLGGRSTNGAHKAELDVGGEVNGLSQTVTTKKHVIYQLSLDAYARSTNTSGFEVWVDDEKLKTITPGSSWEKYQITFTGNGSAQQISIKEIASESNGYGAIIDNISLVDSGEREITPVEAAILSGDVSGVTEEELILATLNEIDATKNLLSDAKAKIFNLNADGSVKDDGSSLTAIDWNPTHDASLLGSTLGVNTGLLYTNAVTRAGKTIYNKEIGVIGKKEAGRYMVLGSNPLRNHYRNASSLNEQMHQMLENSLSWLTDRGDLKTTPFNVVIAQSDDSHYFPDERATRAWLDERYEGQVTYNTADACDNTVLSSCLNSKPDLLIVSQISASDADNEAIAATVDRALKSGTPVLYLHHDGNQKALGKALFADVFDVAYQWDNYWKRLSLQAYDASEDIGVLSDDLASIQTMFQHFRDGDYSFNWSQCSGENCDDVEGLNSEFQAGASIVRSMLNGLDSSKKAIFENSSYRVQKLLALSADKFRESVTYPMDKVTSSDTDFMKSYYADHAVYTYRSINPAQADMGNFSRSDFSHITPITKTVAMESKESFRSAGVYALPGQTVSITRNDTSDLETKIFINTLRSGATHQFAKNGYKRPKFLQSTAVDIKPGETIRLTSPYGGPLQVRFSDNDLPVSFTFENVGEHAYWAGKEDSASFEAKLAAAEYDWAEVVTPGFEVHSKLDKMRTSIMNENWGGAEALATATMRYMHNFPHALAGFQGPGIDVIPEIHDFADANGWTIETLDRVKHMNADQATCGYGCSGNPYDAYWAYNPTGHGDVHELGHGLQGGRRFAGWQNHTMTNYYSYYTKSQFHKDTGGNPECQALPFEKMFNVLQSSVDQTDPAAYVKENLWDKMGWSEGAGMFIQMMMAAQQDGALSDGWLLRARLHVMEREYNRARADEATWNAKRDNLGFGQYSFTVTMDVSDNDWYLIAISYVTQRNYNEYFDMWAMPMTGKAREQVEALGYPVMKQQYFRSGSTAYCYGLDKTALAVDGKQVW